MRLRTVGAVGLVCLVVCVGTAAATDRPSTPAPTPADGGATVEWNHTDTGLEAGRYVGAAPAGDGDVYVVGSYAPVGGDGLQMQVTRFTADGDLAERRLFALGNGTGTQPFDVVEADDGFYVVGVAATDDGGEDAFVTRVGADGTPRWNRTFGGAEPDQALVAAATDDGVAVGGIAGGDRTSDEGRPWLFEVGPDGDRLRNLTLGKPGWDLGGLVVTPDGIVLAGETETFRDAADGWIARVDGTAVRSNVTYTVPVADRFGPTDATVTEDGVVTAGNLVNGTGVGENRTDTGALVTVDPASGDVERVVRLSELAGPTHLEAASGESFVVAGSTGFLFQRGETEVSASVVAGVAADGETLWRAEGPDTRNISSADGVDRVGSRLVVTGLTDFRFANGTLRSLRFNGSVFAVSPPSQDIVDCLGGPDDLGAPDVLRAIAAFNAGDQVCGAVPDERDVLRVIAAFNAGG